MLQRFHRHDLLISSPGSLPPEGGSFPIPSPGEFDHEISRYPAAAGVADFAWRLSLTVLAGDGPLASLPDVEQAVAVLDGGALRLRAQDGSLEQTLSHCLASFAWPGALELHASLAADPCILLRLMMRPDRIRGGFTVVQAATTLPASAHGMLLATAGEWLIRAPAVSCDSTLITDEGLWWVDSEIEWTLTPVSPDATLLLAQLHPLANAPTAAS